MTEGYPRGAGPPPRSFLTIKLAIAGVIMASIAVLWFISRQTRVSDEVQMATRLAACLRENRVMNITLEGQAMIESACRAVVKTGNAAANAECVFTRRETMVTDDGTKSVATACGIAAR